MSVRELGQYMTPDWAAVELVERHFSDLPSGAGIVEPSCGRGAFLRALPADLQVVGVEIDPALASEARRRSGRPVLIGDFRMVDLPFVPQAVIGNPPFATRTVLEFLDRAWNLMEDEGRVGFILPAYTFQTSTTVATIAERWSMRQEMLPRDLFPGLSKPLCFAVLTKGTVRGMVGFALYHEMAAVRRLKARYQQLLHEGEGSVWVAVVRAALEALGGRADLQRIYREIEGLRPTANKFWQEKVRQTLQRIAIRIDQGVWQLPVSEAIAA